jgi:hypothetical protein
MMKAAPPTLDQRVTAASQLSRHSELIVLTRLA